MFKGVPKWCLAKRFVGGLGFQGQKNTHVQENSGLLALPGFAAEGGKAKKTISVLNMLGCLALVPQASKKHLAKKTLRDPFELEAESMPQERSA